MASDNPFLVHLQQPETTSPASTGTEANPFLKHIQEPPPPSPAPSNPFDATLELAKERDGTAAPAPPTSTGPFDPALLTQIDQSVNRMNELGQRGLHEFNSGFWDVMTGAARIARTAGDKIDQAVQDHPVATGFLAAYTLTKRTADYLVNKFGGTHDGALAVIERQTRRMGDLERGKVQAIPAPQGLGERAAETLGSLPGEAATFATTYGLGGPLGWTALKTTQRLADPTAGPVDLSHTAAAALAEGTFFKWMEGLVPAVPQKTTPETNLPVPSELNVALDPPQAEPSLLSPAERLYTGAVRDFYPLEKASKQIGDPEILQLARVQGNVGRAQHFLEYGGFKADTLKPTGNPGIAPLINDLETSGQRTAFEEYLVARRALELDGRGIDSGQPIQVAQRIVAQGDQGPFRKMADQVYQFQDDALQYARDSGLISPDAYDAIKAANQDYVPFFRAGKSEVAVGGRSGQPGQPIKQIEGSQRAVTSPLRNIVRQTVKILNEADKNRLATSLTRHADQPGAENLVVRTKAAPDIAPVASVEDLSSIEVASPGTVSQAEAQAGAPRNFQKFRVYENGKPVEYAIDPDIANALGAYGFRDPNDFIDNIIMKALSTPGQILRAGTTDSPGFFLVKNPVRDQLTLLFQSKTGAKPGIALVDGLMSYVGRTAAYRAWIRGGGAQSTLVSMDLPALRGVIGEMLHDKQTPWWQEVGELAMSPIRLFQEMSQAVEAAPRIGEFKQGMRNLARTGQVQGFPLQSIIPTGDIFRPGAFQRGLDMATGSQLREAAVASRDVTTDFGIRGSSKVMNQWYKIAAFSKAGVQGMDRFLRLHKENPGKAAALGLTYLTIPTLLLHYYQMQDPQYREKYRRLPNWRKVFFWNIDARNLSPDNPTRQLAESKFNGIIPSPVPFEWGMLYKSLPEAIMTSYMLDDPQVLKDLAEQVANQAQPFVSISDRGGIPLPGGKSVIPNLGTSITPFLDIAANRSSFFGSPIETDQELKLPPKMRFDETTTRSAVILSDWMGGVFSPKQTQYLLQQWGGSMTRSAMEAADRALPSGPFGDIPKLKPMADAPVMDFVFGGVAPRSVDEGSSQVVSDFYKKYSEVQQQAAGQKELLKRRQFGEALEGMQQQAPNLLQDQLIEQTATKIQALQKYKRQIVREPTMSRQTKEAQLKSINRMIDSLASIALGKPQLQEQAR